MSHPPAPGSSDFSRYVQDQMSRISAEHVKMKADHADPDYLDNKIRDDLARRLAARRTDPVVRTRHARDSLLRWIYEYRAGARVPLSDSSHGWLDTGRYRVPADQFSTDEMRTAANYLAESGLIEIEFRDRNGVRVRVHRLTEAGAECVENYGGDVANFRDAMKRGGTSIKIGTFQGAAIFGDNATQNVGVQADAMGAFIRELLGALPNLTMDPADRVRAEAALAEVEREVERLDADPDRVRGAFSRFVQGLIDSAPEAITQLMLMFARGFVGPGS